MPCLIYRQYSFVEDGESGLDPANGRLLRLLTPGPNPSIVAAAAMGRLASPAGSTHRFAFCEAALPKSLHTSKAAKLCMVLATLPSETARNLHTREPDPNLEQKHKTATHERTLDTDRPHAHTHTPHTRIGEVRSRAYKCTSPPHDNSLKDGR